MIHSILIKDFVFLSLLGKILLISRLVVFSLKATYTEIKLSVTLSRDLLRGSKYSV